MTTSQDEAESAAVRPSAPDALQLLIDSDPEFATVWYELRGRVFDNSGLDPATRELIVIALDLAVGNDDGTVIHVAAARAAGASVKDVLDTMKLVAFVLGPATIGRLGAGASARLADLLAEPGPS